MTLPELEALLACDDNTEAVDFALRAHADAMISCAKAVQEYLEWGAMTGSDRDLFADKFEAALKALEDVK